MQMRLINSLPARQRFALPVYVARLPPALLSILGVCAPQKPNNPLASRHFCFLPQKRGNPLSLVEH